MDCRKQIKTKVLRYGLVAFRDDLSCQIFNIADLNGPRRKVTGASVKIDINGDIKRGTIISVSDQKKCLQIEKEKLNVAKFFGLPNRKKYAPVIVPVSSVPIPTQPVTRSSTKRKFETATEQPKEASKPSTTPKRRRLSKIPVRAALRKLSSRTLRSKCCSHCKVALSYRRPSSGSIRNRQSSSTKHSPASSTQVNSTDFSNTRNPQRTMPNTTRYTQDHLNHNTQTHLSSYRVHSPEDIATNISQNDTKQGFTDSNSLPNLYPQDNVKPVAERANKDHPHIRPSQPVLDKTIVKERPFSINRLHDIIESSNMQSSTDCSATNLKLYLAIDQTRINEHSPFIKQELNKASLDLPVYSPLPDCLSPIPSVTPINKASPTSTGSIPSPASQQSTPTSPSLRPLISTPPVKHQIVTPSSANTPVPECISPTQLLQPPTSLVKATVSLKEASLQNCSMSVLPLVQMPGSLQANAPVTFIGNDPMLPAHTPAPVLISPIASVEHQSPISPALPSPIYTSSPLKTDLVNVARTSFSSPLDGHRSLDLNSPPVVDPSTPSYLTLETSASTTEPLIRSFVHLSMPIDFDSPMLIDPPTPDDFFHSSSSFVDSSSMSGCETLFTSPPMNQPIPESISRNSEVNYHRSAFSHTKISTTHNTLSMSGIEPLIQSFSEYPTPDQAFFDPERDPITNHLFISGPMKTRLDRARFPNISKARRSLQFTVIDPCLAETNLSFDNPKQIPLTTTGCSSNRNKDICVEDLPILDWLNTAPPPMQWMHEELMKKGEQRTDQQEHSSSPTVNTQVSFSNINRYLTSPGWSYSSSNEDQVKLFADEDSDILSISSLSPIVIASTDTPNPQVISQTPSQLISNNQLYSNTSQPSYQTNPLSANVNTNPFNQISPFIGNTTYPAQQAQMYTPIIAVRQTNNYVPFTETCAKLLPIPPPLQVTLAHTPQFTIQRPFYPSASGFPSLQSNTPSNQQTCFYTPTPQFQLTAPVQTIPQQTPMSSAPTYIHPQTYTATPSFYQPFQSTPIVQTPSPFYDTPQTPVQIFPKSLSYARTLSTTTPNQQFIPDGKKTILATETITSSINSIRESQRTIYDSSTMTPSCTKVPNSENCTQTSSSSSQAQEKHLVQESYYKNLQSSSFCTSSQFNSHTQGQHDEFYQNTGPCSTPFSHASQLSTPIITSRPGPCPTPLPRSEPCPTPLTGSDPFPTTISRPGPCPTPLPGSNPFPTTISRPGPCPTPLPRSDSFTKTTVTVVQKSAKDVEVLRQLKYFVIDDPKLLRLKAAHVAKRYITSQYVQHALDDIPDDAGDESVPYPFIIDTQVLREALSTSCASPQHFARFLFDKMFTVAEFRNHSVRGVGGRRVLNQSKMASIKVAVSTIFPMENNEWRRCESSINNHIKALEKKMKRLSWLKFDNYQS